MDNLQKCILQSARTEKDKNLTQHKRHEHKRLIN